MKKASIMTLIFVLTATLFAGCRNMGNNTTGTTMTPATSSHTKATAPTMPVRPLPSGTHGTTNPSGITSTPGGTTEPGTSGMTGRAVRPSARGPRY